MDLRCEGKKLGELRDNILEIRCKSVFCGHVSGTVVIHRFDVLTGKLIETKKYKDSGRQTEHDRSHDGIAALRHP